MLSKLLKAFGYLNGLLYMPFLTDSTFIPVQGRLNLMRRYGIVGIGHGTTIWPGVKLTSLVAAGFVVIRNVPAGTLVAGNPAKLIREPGPWQMD